MNDDEYPSLELFDKAGAKRVHSLQKRKNSYNSASSNSRRSSPSDASFKIDLRNTSKAEVKEVEPDAKKKDEPPAERGKLDKRKKTTSFRVPRHKPNKLYWQSINEF